MKKILSLILILVTFSLSAQEKNGFCNFLLELGKGVEMDSTYMMTGVAFENLKLKHQKKLMAKLNFQVLYKMTVNIPYLQKGLANICRYKKWEIEKVRIERKGAGVLLELHYAIIPKDAKSKAQAVWVKG